MNLSAFDPLIKAAQRMSGDVGVVYYDELQMLIFIVDTENGPAIIHKILLTDASNLTGDPIKQHIPKIRLGLKTLKHMREKHREDYEKVTSGVTLKKDYQF
jgi:hypothetical protein